MLKRFLNTGKEIIDNYLFLNIKKSGIIDSINIFKDFICKKRIS